MANKIENPPSAFVLMDSMRSIGYTFNSAVADIVDNAISAGASRLDIFVSSNPDDIYLGFVDNGKGMTNAELRLAMKYGSKGKDEERSEKDLGRFGLGLKSASLSQCKKLTVISKIGDQVFGDVWDMTIVEEENSWSLLELEQDEIEKLPCINELKKLNQGTLVLWQDFDVLRTVTEGYEYEGLKDSMDEATDYLGLVFHRFIASKEISIFVNEREIECIDPFLESNKKTEVGKEFDITITDQKFIERHITVTPFLLPYLKDLSNEDKKKLGGIANISTKQGFYVYRNRRLIIHGTWFRMSHKNELAKYARIRVDIPTSLDYVWKIDVKKQTAELPPIIKKQLQSCVDKINYSSKKKNEHRHILKAEDKTTIWQKNVTRDDKAVYKINRDAPYIREIMNSFDSEELAKVNALINAVEKSIPYHDMYTDEANDNIDTSLSLEDKKQLTAETMFIAKQIAKIRCVSISEAVGIVLLMDPFKQYEWLKEAVMEELSYEH